MAVRDRLRKDAARHLVDGEQIQAVFYAKRPGTQYNDRAVVATDRRLLLMTLNFLGRALVWQARHRARSSLGRAMASCTR